MRERGLKLPYWLNDTATTRVAPHAGAWVETCLSHNYRIVDESLPMRERGLKLLNQIFLVIQVLSLPMRERGLKHQVVSVSHLLFRRSPCGSVG